MFDDDKRGESSEELKKNAELKEQSKSKKELMNKTLLEDLFAKREDEDRNLITDEMIKTNWREFLDVLELEEIEREILEFENEKEVLMMLIYLSICDV